MQSLRPTHKINDVYASLIGGNIYILGTDTYLSVSVVERDGDSVVELSDDEAETHTITVSDMTYKRAGQASNTIASEAAELRALGPNASTVYEDEDDSEPAVANKKETPEPSSVPVEATAKINGVLAAEVGAGVYVLESDNIFRSRGNQSVFEEISDGSTFEVSPSTMIDAMNAAETQKRLMAVGETHVTD